MIFYNQIETSIKVVLSVFLQRKEYFNKLPNLERGDFMLRQHKKITAVVGLTISALMISSACYAQDDPNDGYVIHYDFETQETTYYGYDKENHEFYEVDDYVEPDRTASDGTADIADAPDEMEGVNPGNIYVDNQSIKEDVDNPYTILLFSGSMPTVYKYNKEQPDDPWTVVSQEKVNLLEGKVNKVSKSYLIFTDQNNDDIKVKIKKDERWHPGDEIKVFGLTKTKDGKVKLAKQYGYYKVE